MIMPTAAALAMVVVVVMVMPTTAALVVAVMIMPAAAALVVVMMIMSAVAALVMVMVLMPAGTILIVLVMLMVLRSQKISAFQCIIRAIDPYQAVRFQRILRSSYTAAKNTESCQVISGLSILPRVIRLSTCSIWYT